MRARHIRLAATAFILVIPALTLGLPRLALAAERVFRVEVDFWCPAEFGNFEAKVYRTDGVEILEASPEKKVIEFKVKAGKALEPAQVKAAAEESGLRVRNIEVREIK